MNLSAQNISVKIGENYLLRNISAVFEAGKLTALAGPNGSGKTTLLRVLAGLRQPQTGEVWLENKKIQTYKRLELARKISFVPQDTHIEFDFRVKEVIEMGRHAHLGRLATVGKRDAAIVAEAAERADVTHLLNRYVTRLSGGERQRVVIARSLATEADIMILDEPTASLDIAHALDILELARKLAREGKTIVLAIHDINAAARFADNVILLRNGEIYKQGEKSEVLQTDNLNEVFEVCADNIINSEGDSVFVFHRAKAGSRSNGERALS